MADRSWIHTELARNLVRANRTARQLAGSEPRALSVKLTPSVRELRIDLSNGASLTVPVAIIPELSDARRSQLMDVEILPGGDGLHWESLDFTVSVAGLVASLFGPSSWMSELGRRGGSRSSVAKAHAARRNGLRGGRPRSRR
jgi:hypothetical protein